MRFLIFYLVFDWLEDFLIKDDDTSSKIEDMEYVSECWYDAWLRTSREPCYGRTFDYSDHVVLYFAHTLPIPLCETLYALIVIPQQSSWNFNKRQGGIKITDPSSHDRGYSGWFGIIVLSLMIMYLLYLFLITWLNLYVTVAFFHTGGESIAGFMITLIVQVPLYYLQCSTEHQACTYFQKWGKVFFPQTTTMATNSQGNECTEEAEVNEAEANETTSLIVEVHH